MNEIIELLSDGMKICCPISMSPAHAPGHSPSPVIIVAQPLKLLDFLVSSLSKCLVHSGTKRIKSEGSTHSPFPAIFLQRVCRSFLLLSVSLVICIRAHLLYVSVVPGVMDPIKIHFS